MSATKVVNAPAASSHRRCPWARPPASILAAALLLVAGVAAARPPKAPVIAAVDIRGNERTLAEVIRRELLFVPGDTLAPARLAETERNLRNLLFLGSVRVRSESAAPGSVRVVVEVQDRYARATSPLLAGDLEEVSYGAVAVDYNLFGRGQQARLTLYDDAVRGRRIDGTFVDPQLRGTRLRAAAEAGWAEEGHTLAASLSQPFHTLATPWAFGASLSSHAERVRLYARGELAARYDDRTDAGSVWLVASRGDAVKVRPGVQLSFSDRRFAADAPYGYAPDDRRRVLPALSLTVWRPRYVTDRFIQDLGPAEDFQVGSWLSLSTGVSVAALGSDLGYTYGALTLAPRHHFANGWYTFAALRGSSRWRRRRAWDLHTSAQVSAYRRFRRWPLTPTLATRLAFDRIDRPEDAGSQLLLGVDSGLRGVPPRSFDGRNRLLAGVELRPLLRRRPAWALGAALFAETGAAWESTPTWSPAVGAGLRLGLPRLYDTPVLRADLARGLRQGAWQLSFGLGQYY